MYIGVKAVFIASIRERIGSPLGDFGSYSGALALRGTQMLEMCGKDDRSGRLYIRAPLRFLGGKNTSTNRKVWRTLL